MNNLVLIFQGGGLGSLARYGVGRALAPWSLSLPYGTLHQCAGLYGIRFLYRVCGVAG